MNALDTRGRKARLAVEFNLERLTKIAVPLAFLLQVAACHERHPPVPTAEQSDELNEADSMLSELANEEGPEAKGSGPSNRSE